MPTVEKTRGGSVYLRALEREMSIGDRANVDEEMAGYLCGERGDFERAEGGPDYTSIPPNLEDATYDELMEIARDDDLTGRSSMDKGELIEALRSRD